MPLLIAILLLMTATAPVTIYDFRKGTPIADWHVQDDTVMGGHSAGHIEMTDKGYARFHGHVSLENNGGFSSVRHELDPLVRVTEEHDKFVLRIKGDGKRYTLRVKDDPDHRYLYGTSFPTSGEWEFVELPFADMRARHHGNDVDAPKFTGGTIHVVQVLIGNKKEQDFELLIDRIEAR